MPKFCSNCGHKIEENLKFCTNCGASTENVTPLQKVSAMEYNQPIVDNPKKKIIPIIGIVVAVVVLIAIASVAFLKFDIFSDKISNKEFRRLLENSNFTYSADFLKEYEDSAKIVRQLDVSDSGYYFVLFEIEERYFIGAVSEERVFQFETEYLPLKAMLEHYCIYKDQSVVMYEKAQKYVESYGYTAFKKEDVAKEFLRELTGEEGIISTEGSRSIVEDKHKDALLGKSDSATDVKVFFENGSAVPVYIALKSGDEWYLHDIYEELNFVGSDENFEVIERYVKNNPKNPSDKKELEERQVEIEENIIEETQAQIEEDIIGAWKTVSGSTAYMVFFNDGTVGLMNESGKRSVLNYVIEGDTLLFKTSEGDSVKMKNVKVSEDYLTYVSDSDQNYKWKRVPLKEVEEAL